jgi:hypothetical protein
MLIVLEGCRHRNTPSNRLIVESTKNLTKRANNRTHGLYCWVKQFNIRLRRLSDRQHQKIITARHPRRRSPPQHSTQAGLLNL